MSLSKYLKSALCLTTLTAAACAPGAPPAWSPEQAPAATLGDPASVAVGPLADPGERARATLARLRRIDPGLEVAWRPDGHTASFVTGQLRPADPRPATLVGQSALRELGAPLFGIRRPDVELSLTDMIPDARTAFTHLTYAQTLGGHPVHGREVKVHLDPDGAVVAMHGLFAPELPPASVPAEPTVPVAAVEQHVRDATGLEGQLIDRTAPELTVSLRDDTPTLTWRVRYLAEGMASAMEYFVDATTGALHDQRRLGHDAVGEGCDPHGRQLSLNTQLSPQPFSLRDTTRSTSIKGLDQRGSTSWITGSAMVDADNLWCADEQAGAVAGHYNMGLVLDYFATVHGRSSFDGSDHPVRMGYDARFERSNGDTYAGNAFSIGMGRFRFGEGDPGQRPWTGLDLVGHEFGHAVLDSEGVYSGENRYTAAIHEHIADVIGTLAEWHWSNAYGERNFWMFEEMDADYAGQAPLGLPIAGGGRILPGAPIADVGRSLSTPDRAHRHAFVARDGQQHANSGILSKAFHLLWNGGVHPDSGVRVDGIGHAATEAVYYKAIDDYVGPGTRNFRDLRIALVQAARELYGAGSPEQRAIQLAFTAVGINPHDFGLIPVAEDFETWDSFGAVAFGNPWGAPGVGHTDLLLEDGTVADGTQLGLTPSPGFGGHVRGEFLLTVPPPNPVLVGGQIELEQPVLEISVGFQRMVVGVPEASVLVSFMPHDGSPGEVWNAHISKDGVLDTTALDLAPWAGEVGTVNVIVANAGVDLNTPVIFDTLRVVNRL